MKTCLAVAALTALIGGGALAEARSGTVQITVQDEYGALVENAPVYIYGTQKTRFVGGKEIDGSTLMAMPAGSYRISSALVRRTGDYLDRFASHEAFVEVADGSHQSVLLTLRPLDNPMESVVIAEMRKIGLAPILVQYPR